MFIKNFENLATTPQRKVILDLVEEALSSIQTENVLDREVNVSDGKLMIKDNDLPAGRQDFDLSNFDRVFLIGFGKGSAKNSKFIEDKLGQYLSEGYVIDTNPEDFKKIKFTQGTHPLLSSQNVEFTDNLIKRFKLLNLTEKDLILVVVCG